MTKPFKNFLVWLDRSNKDRVKVCPSPMPFGFEERNKELKEI